MKRIIISVFILAVMLPVTACDTDIPGGGVSHGYVAVGSLAGC